MDRVISSFNNIFTNSAGKATLTEVVIDITDNPQIMLAEIHELVVPEEITPGESATFKVVLLPHWTATNGSRKIEKEVILDIPDNFTKGQASFSVKAEDPFDDLFFDFSFDENDEEETPLPENLDELIKQIEDGQTDLGIITITLTPNDAGFDFSFLDDPFTFENDDLSEDDQIPPIETKIVIDGFIITGSMEKPVNVIDKESPPIEDIDDMQVE